MSIILKNENDNLKLENGTYLFAIQKWSIKGLQDIEKLFFVAVNTDTNEFLSDENSELLVTSSTIYGKDWLEAKNVIDIEKIYNIANDKCLSKADSNFEDFLENIKLQNEDRANLQEKTLKLHLENQIDKLQETKEKHLSLGRTSLSKATEGKIQALIQRFDKKSIEINNKKSIISSKEEIAIGLIKLIN